MKLLVLALCALTLVSSRRMLNENWLEESLPEFSIGESAFVSGREYQFFYEGQLLTGIPSSSKQHSGSRLQAVVSFFFQTPESAVLKIKSIRMGKLNRQVPNPRAILPFQIFEEVPIAQELKAKLFAPVKFVYNKGLISGIVFDGVEQPWSANIKRGILNLIQVNLQRRNQVGVSEAFRALNEESPVVDPSNDFFRVMENTIDGECETLYTVVTEPHPFYRSGPILNVTKAINFENCQKRPHIKYNFRFQDDCPTDDPLFNSNQKFLKSSSVYRFNITGTPENFVIERAAVESQYVVVPFNEEGNVVITFVNQTLVLVRTNPIKQIPQVSSPVPSDSQMIYSPDWDIMKENFFMEGEETFHRDSPYTEIPRKVEFASELFRQLVSAIGENVQEPAPRIFSRLVKFFRLLKIEEIERIWKKFYVDVPSDFTPEQHKKIKSLLVDAMAFAGTKENVFFLVQKIKSRQIPPVWASFAVKSFINIRVVSKEMIQELLSLAESEVCRRSFFLKQSVFLTVGSMMNALCSPNEDVLAVEFKVVDPERRFCPRELKQRYVQLLFEKFTSSQKWEDKILFLKSLSNAGLDLSIFELEKVIRNSPTRFPMFIRAEAVLALRQLKDIMPRKVQKVLMPIYMNRYEVPELRIVSAYMIFQTLPERPVLDEMARRVFSEPSRQVASFVFSYMHTMANSTNKCERRFAERLQLALRHIRFPMFSFMMGYSANIHKSFHSWKYNTGFDTDFISIYSNTTYMPKHLSFSFSPVFGGFWSKFLTSFRFSSEGFENYFWKYFGDRGFFFEKPMEELLQRSPRSIKTRSPSQELRSMFESLRIRPREYFPNRPKAMFSLAFKNQEFGFLPFSFDAFPEEFTSFLESGRFNIRSFEEFLEEGYSFRFYKALFLHEMDYKIPTSIGFPLKFSVVIPTVMSLTGHVKASFVPNDRLSNIKLFVRDLKPSFASTWFTDVVAWNPVVNSGLKVIAGAKFFYPFTAKMELDFKSSPFKFLFSFQPPERPVKVLVLETRPVTFTRVWPETFKVWTEPEEITVQGEDWTRINNFHYNFGEYFMGIKMKLRGFWHRTPMMKLADTPFCPLSGPNRLVFMTEPGFKMPKEIFFKFEGDWYRQFSGEFKPEFPEFENFEESEEAWEPEFSKFRSYSPSEPSEHMFKFEIFTKDSSAPRKFFWETFAKCGKFWKYCKFSSRFERTPVPRFEQSPFKFCFDAETLLPETPYSFSELVGKKALSQVRVNWGPSCSSEKFFKLNVVAERSNRQIQYERMSPEFQFFSEPREDDRTFNGPVFQYEHLYKYSQLLKYKLDAEFSQLPVVFKNYTNMFYRFLKYYFYWQTDVAQVHVRNPANRFRAIFTFDPIFKQYFNVTVKTPIENATFKDIPIRLPFLLTPLNIRKSYPLTSVFDIPDPVSPYTNGPMCHVSSRYVKTFDQVSYSVPLSTCWTVLVKDCDAEPNFGVYMKKLSPDSEMKKIKIITPYHRFFLVPESEDYESVKIEFDGQKFSPEEFQPVREHGHVIARAERMGKYMEFYLPETGISVYFDGYSVNIKTSHFYRSMQCGLCGHFDYESSDEFRMPNFELTEDVREFYRSYVFEEEGCSVPELNQVCSTPFCEPMTTTPLYCPVCKQIVRFAKRDSDLKKPELKRLIEQFCEQVSHSSEVCKRFFQPLIPRFHKLILEGKPVFQICSQINACSSSLFESADFEDSDLDTFYPKREFQYDSTAFPVLATKVLEQNYQLCFSKVPVPHCPHHSFPRTFKPQKRVVYACLPRDDFEAETFFRRASRFQVIPEVEELDASFTETEEFPETCSSLY